MLCGAPKGETQVIIRVKQLGVGPLTPRDLGERVTLSRV